MKKIKPVVYVAGPFRAMNDDGTPNQWQQEQNIRRAEELALEVWYMGGAAMCPHTNTRFYQGAAPDNVWLEGDLALLAKCEAILLTPDWRRSVGATAEHNFAREHGIPVLHGVTDLRVFMERWNAPATEGFNPRRAA